MSALQTCTVFQWYLLEMKLLHRKALIQQASVVDYTLVGLFFYLLDLLGLQGAA